MLDGLFVRVETFYMKAILIAMAVLVAPVMAEDDDDEINDFIGGVYRGSGTVHKAGSVIMTEEGLIFKSGSRFIYQNGKVCQHVGSTYITEDNSVVVRAGSAFVSNRGITEKVGSSYIGSINSFSSGSTMIRQGQQRR
jgi:hypothetical protein